jgi:hypothetical protein
MPPSGAAAAGAGAGFAATFPFANGRTLVYTHHSTLAIPLFFFTCIPVCREKQP